MDQHCVMHAGPDTNTLQVPNSDIAVVDGCAEWSVPERMILTTHVMVTNAC